MDKTKRIQLLTNAEIADLYDRPDFNAEERVLFFALSQSEEEMLNQYQNTRTRLHFILILGYFKAKQQFFMINFEDAPDDVRFILKTYFSITETDWLGGVSRDSIRSQKKDILALFNYREWSTDLEPQIQDKLGELIRYYPKGNFSITRGISRSGNNNIG